MKLEFQVIAYLPAYTEIADVINGSVMPSFSMKKSRLFESEGYPVIGSATISVDLHTDDLILASKLETLKLQLQTVRAENFIRENTILNEISKLQAITLSPTTKEI